MMNNIKTKNWLSRSILIIISILISAVVYNLFLLPLSLVTGGTSGIATITHYLYDMDPAFIILVLSLACCIFSFMYLGKERTAGTLLATILYPIMVKVTADFSTKFVLDTSDIWSIKWCSQWFNV